MSRIDYCEPDDTRSFLRACAYGANTERHLKGKKGQAALLELEAALLALPEKALQYSRFVVIPEKEGDQGSVCALGAVALKRKMDKGLGRQEALRTINKEFHCHEDDSSLEVGDTAKYMNYVHNFAWAVIEQNDEYGGRTPEECYKRVLKWCQNSIIRPVP